MKSPKPEVTEAELIAEAMRLVNGRIESTRKLKEDPVPPNYYPLDHLSLILDIDESNLRRKFAIADVPYLTLKRNKDNIGLRNVRYYKLDLTELRREFKPKNRRAT